MSARQWPVTADDDKQASTSDKPAVGWRSPPARTALPPLPLSAGVVGPARDGDR